MLVRRHGLSRRAVLTALTLVLVAPAGVLAAPSAVRAAPSSGPAPAGVRTSITGGIHSVPGHQVLTRRGTTPVSVPSSLALTRTPQPSRSVRTPVPGGQQGAGGASAVLQPLGEAHAVFQFDFATTGNPGDSGPCIAWTPALEGVFERAAAIWATHIISDVPIRVRAALCRQGANILGGAGPGNFYSGPDLGDGVSYYASALADALYGQDLDTSLYHDGINPDITATFNSDLVNDFYTGLDGHPGPNQIDMVTLVLHELGHGLGFTGSPIVGGTGRGYIGLPLSQQVTGGAFYGGYYYGGVDYLFSYDRLVTNAADGGRPVATGYANGSAALGMALSSGDLTWSGVHGIAANGGTPPRLYAPTSWSGGSSFSHLDEATYPPGTLNALMTPVINNAEVIHAPGPIVLGMMADLGWLEPADAGTYTPATAPRRLLDTRVSVPAAVITTPHRQLEPDERFILQVTGGSTGVPTDASAVTLNVTALVPTGANGGTEGFLSVGPTGSVHQSSINVYAGGTTPNLVVSRVNPHGDVVITNGTHGRVDVLVDLQGWDTPVLTAAGYQPLEPQRLLDTRPAASGALAAPGMPIPAGGRLTLTVTGPGTGVPDTATAVALNTTVVTPAGTDGSLAVGPIATRTESNLNFAPGQVVANLVVSKLDSAGHVVISNNSSGPQDVVVDLEGYYAPAVPAGALVPLKPVRLLDTRTTGSAATLPQRQIAPRESYAFPVTGGATGVPTQATGVSLNVAAVVPAGSVAGNINIGPAASFTSSTLNFRPGQTVANAAFSKISDGMVVVTNQSRGPIDVVVDVNGWYGPAS